MSPLFSGQSLGGQWRKWILGAVKDLFNRANTVTGLGSADTGQPWVASRGNWFINTNKAKSTDTPSTYPLASVQAGLMTPYLKADVDTAGGVGLAFWVSDTQNWYGVHGFTATTTSYSQTCATYSQTGPSYYCGGSYTQTGPSYYCGGSYSQTGPTYYCSGSYVQTGPSYYCGGSITGPNYNSVCQSSYGPTYGSGCSGWSQAYDGFRGYWYAKCAGYYGVGPSWTCTAWYQVGPFYSCGSPVGPNYGQQCTNVIGPNYGQTCSNPVGPNYGQTCSNVVGPNYGSQCASYSQSSNTSAGATSLRLIKSTANVVSTLVDQAIAQLPASLQVFFNGNQIVTRAYSGAGQTTQIGSDITYTDANPTKATVHGIVLAPGGYYQGTTVDNFSANTVQ